MTNELSWLADAVNAAPNPGHTLTSVLGPQHLLIDAPAGCGKTQALAEKSGKLAERAYAAQSAAGQQAGASAAGAEQASDAGKDDDVVDAEFEEEKEDKK